MRLDRADRPIKACVALATQAEGFESATVICGRAWSEEDKGVVNPGCRSVERVLIA